MCRGWSGERRESRIEPGKLRAVVERAGIQQRPGQHPGVLHGGIGPRERTILQPVDHVRAAAPSQDRFDQVRARVAGRET